MQRYLQQLIDDIRQAATSVNPPHQVWYDSAADPENELEMEDISYVEKFIYGEKIPVSHITGIETMMLPPPEKLSIEQMALLAGELEKLLDFYHFIPDFPPNYPMHLRYPFLYGLWDEEHVPLSFGENHIEFCSYEPENCPFPGYCSICNEINAQMKFDEDHDSGKGDGIMDNVDPEDLLPDF